MRTRILVPFASALTLILVPVAATSGQIPADSDPDAAGGFPWLCFVTSVAALVGLYVVVRRRERATEEGCKSGHRPEAVWYCRECDRDVSGSTCPHCGAPNPFTHEPLERPARKRTRRDRPENIHHRGTEAPSGQ
jgi:hypothetical protein